MGIRTYLASGVFTATYATSRVSGMATGFNLTVSDTIDSEPTGELVVGISENGLKEYTLGSKSGIVLSDGVVKSRTHEGKTVVIVDPILDLFKKAVVVGNANSYLEKQIGLSPNAESSDFVVLLSNADVIAANFELSKGNVGGFMDKMFGLNNGEGNNVKIRYDKVEESPVVSQLSKLKTGGGASSQNRGSFFTNDAFFNRNGLYTVESIFQSTVLQLGLELYWVRDNIYSLEPPRLTNPNAEAEPQQIDWTDIVEINTVSDPYNIPDIIIPSTFMPDIIGTSGVSSAAHTAVAGGVLSKMDGKRSMKIVTYEIPNFLLNPIQIAMNTASSAVDSVYGPLKKLTDKDAIKYATTFYGSHARRSKEFMLNRGTCDLIFRPDITVPYSWYSINGTEMFVTSITHTISRNSATTRLVVVGKRNKDTETEDSSTPLDPSLILEKEKETLDKADEKISTAVREINTKVKEVIDKVERRASGDMTSFLDFHGQNLSKDEVALMFGDDEEVSRVLARVSSVHKTIKV